jgi:hypothetical protein
LICFNTPPGVGWVESLLGLQNQKYGTTILTPLPEWGGLKNFYARILKKF